MKTIDFDKLDLVELSEDEKLSIQGGSLLAAFLIGVVLGYFFAR